MWVEHGCRCVTNYQSWSQVRRAVVCSLMRCLALAARTRRRGGGNGHPAQYQRGTSDKWPTRLAQTLCAAVMQQRTGLLSIALYMPGRGLGLSQKECTSLATKLSTKMHRSHVLRCRLGAFFPRNFLIKSREATFNCRRTYIISSSTIDRQMVGPFISSLHSNQHTHSLGLHAWLGTKLAQYALKKSEPLSWCYPEYASRRWTQSTPTVTNLDVTVRTLYPVACAG